MVYGFDFEISTKDFVNFSQCMHGEKINVTFGLKLSSYVTF